MRGLTMIALLGATAVASVAMAGTGVTLNLKPVYDVKSASVKPAALGRVELRASGDASTPGWTLAQLTLEERRAPIDGIYDFDFVASPPTNIMAQVITPISVGPQAWRAPKGLRGIRVHSKTNVVVAMLPGK